MQVTIGENEVATGTVNLKDIDNSVDSPVPRAELIPRLLALLQAKGGSVPAPAAPTTAAAAGAAGVPAGAGSGA